jgi:dolichol kinase
VVATALPLVTPFRKIIHIGGVLFVPVAMYNRYLALALAFLGLLLFIFFERQKRRVVPGFFRHLYRERELGTVAMEPLAYLLSIIALLALSTVFVPEACYVAIIVMTLGDGVAGLAGRAMNGPRLPYSRKTVYGTLAGFIAAAVAGYFIAGVPAAIAGAAGGMAAEALAGKYDNAATAAAALFCAVIVSLPLPLL